MRQLHQKIALLLPTDADVAHYALICKTSCNSVTNSLWCLRFKDTFDRPIDVDATDTSRLANVYKVRSEVSRGYSCFTLNDGGRQKGEKLRLLNEVKFLHNPNYLRMLHELIRQSNTVRRRTPDGREVMAGLNLDFIRELIMIPKQSERHLDILDAIHETHDLEFWSPRKIVAASKRESLVLVIQLCLAHLVLDPNIPNKIGGLDLGQRAAYSDHEKQPMFLGNWKQDINIRWVLSTLSFFQVQFLSDEDGALTHEYAALEQDQLPQPWLGRLQDETQTIGSHWKGAYTWLDHDKLIKFRRSGRDDGDFFVDSAEDFHDLSIFFDESRFSTEAWPRDFEILLSTDPYVSDLGPPTPKPNRALRSFGGNKAVHRTYPLRSFFGTARDLRKPSHLYGRIHALPPQQKIPGFQRISFLKFCYAAEGLYDPDQVWGYEGCVLPGGRIIIGRWFDATFHFAHSDVEPLKWFSGPFIYWNVDRCAAEDPILPQEALDFLAHLNDLGIGKRSTFPS
ncbi:hypothetical protein B0O99DRAFT_517653 [Bisporella sp. PMI_857]|nr:hypothetical protein B0O99DRAFT_517653 [Bisporella sp. PMI_857]